MADTPLPSIEHDPMVREARERLRAFEALGADLESRLKECERTEQVLRAQFESLETEAFLGKAKPATLEKLRSALAEAVAAREAAQRDADVYCQQVPQRRAVVREVEIEAQHQVNKRLEPMQIKEVKHLAALLQEALAANARVLEIQQAARTPTGWGYSCPLPFRAIVGYDLVGRPTMVLEELVWEWLALPDIKKILDSGA
jgi:hypothetical protein